MTECAVCGREAEPKKQIIVTRGTYCGKKCYLKDVINWYTLRYGDT